MKFKKNRNLHNHPLHYYIKPAQLTPSPLESSEAKSNDNISGHLPSILGVLSNRMESCCMTCKLVLLTFTLTFWLQDAEFGASTLLV